MWYFCTTAVHGCLDQRGEAGVEEPADDGPYHQIDAGLGRSGSAAQRGAPTAPFRDLRASASEMKLFLLTRRWPPRGSSGCTSGRSGRRGSGRPGFATGHSRRACHSRRGRRQDRRLDLQIPEGRRSPEGRRGPPGTSSGDATPARRRGRRCSPEGRRPGRSSCWRSGNSCPASACLPYRGRRARSCRSWARRRRCWCP